VSGAETVSVSLNNHEVRERVAGASGLRFANRIFEPLWNCHHIERIEVTWGETLTVEGRTAFTTPQENSTSPWRAFDPCRSGLSILNARRISGNV
jgi:hypothetical protein